LSWFKNTGADHLQMSLVSRPGSRPALDDHGVSRIDPQLPRALYSKPDFSGNSADVLRTCSPVEQMCEILLPFFTERSGVLAYPREVSLFEEHSRH